MAEERSCASAGSCSQESCEGCPSAAGAAPQDFHEDLNQYSAVRKVIAVVSGKGGVGKSFVTASLASLMQKKGYMSAILDADITGPSIPKMYGLHERAKGNEMGIFPVETGDGIRVMSVNFLLEHEDDPVVWRGPVIAGSVTQFWTDVVWGDVDYMFVDMPPGTGDVPLTVFQSLPVDGIVIVTTPQELVGMIVKKAYNMAKMMDVPVIGLVENYSYLKCPDCGKEIPVFGESQIDKVAAELGLPVLGRLPIEPSYAALVDEGKFTMIQNSYLDAAIPVLEQL